MARLSATQAGAGVLTSGTVNACCLPATRNSRPIYRAFFWINAAGQYPVPRDSYYMAGAGGQTTMIVPSHDLVVVRRGHYKGETAGVAAFRKALTLLMAAVPKRT